MKLFIIIILSLSSCQNEYTITNKQKTDIYKQAFESIQDRGFEKYLIKENLTPKLLLNEFINDIDSLKIFDKNMEFISQFDSNDLYIFSVYSFKKIKDDSLVICYHVGDNFPNLSCCISFKYKGDNWIKSNSIVGEN